MPATMIPRDDVAALIAALEGVADPSRELDHRLAAALGADPADVPRYTASLDCAHRHLHPDALYCRVDVAADETTVVLYARRGEIGIGACAAPPRPPRRRSPTASPPSRHGRGAVGKTCREVTTEARSTSAQAPKNSSFLTNFLSLTMR